LVRVGFGSDSHRFEKNGAKPLVLGGVELSSEGGLEANSDGDVILHALFNALSQACGGESIGRYVDPLFAKGITDSKQYLPIALDMVKSLEYRICNIGIMIEAKRPFIPAETNKKIVRSIARLTSLDERNIGITYTSGEGLTAFGRGEGILAQAVVSLVPE
jgi:2-C-methyl-D-erythritol 2,4-cyclodiphosphate synthase